MRRFGVVPHPVNTPASLDSLKAAAYPLVRSVNRAVNLVERGLRYAKRAAT